tara:strand:+ start:4038 stop:4580 length:543 start_codon:yes stop_codon:yes gene_type:complete
MKLSLFFSLVLATCLFGCISLKTQESLTITDINGETHEWPMKPRLIEEYKVLWCEEHKDYEIIEVLLIGRKINKVSTILVPLSFQSHEVLSAFEGKSKVVVQEVEKFDDKFNYETTKNSIDKRALLASRIILTNDSDTEGAFLLDEPMSRENGESYEVEMARPIHPFLNIPTLVVVEQGR